MPLTTEISDDTDKKSCLKMLNNYFIFDFQKLILNTLHFCLRVDTEGALKAGAMEVFTSLLSHKDPVIRARAARDIMDLR